MRSISGTWRSARRRTRVHVTVALFALAAIGLAACGGGSGNHSAPSHKAATPASTAAPATSATTATAATTPTTTASISTTTTTAPTTTTSKAPAPHRSDDGDADNKGGPNDDDGNK